MTGLTGGRLAGFDLWQGSCVRLWPTTLNVLQPAAVQAAPVIFYAATWWKDAGSLFAGLELHQRKSEKKGERARLSLKWELLHGCVAWTDERVNLIWQHTTMSNDSNASHYPLCFCVVSLATFFPEAWPYLQYSLCYTALFASIVCAAACCLPSVCA